MWKGGYSGSVICPSSRRSTAAWTSPTSSGKCWSLLSRGRIEEQLLAPHEAGTHAHLHDPLQEPPEDLEAVALADPGEGRVIGQGFMQVVAEVPTNAEAVGHDPHELPLAAQILAEKDDLELEEDDRVHRWSATLGVEWGHHLPHEREVQPRLKTAVEVVFGDQVL